MTRLQPNQQYKAFVKALKTGESKTVDWPGSRLDFYMRHTDYLVTITSNVAYKSYSPIDRHALINPKVGS